MIIPISKETERIPAGFIIYLNSRSGEASHTKRRLNDRFRIHYHDVIISTMASQITSLVIVHSTVYSGTDERKHESSASLAFVWGIHRWPVNSPHKGPVTRKRFSFDDVIMCYYFPDWYIALFVTRSIFNVIFHRYSLSTFWLILKKLCKNRYTCM